MVRILKNLRGKLVDDNLIKKDIAPSYYLVSGRKLRLFWVFGNNLRRFFIFRSGDCQKDGSAFHMEAISPIPMSFPRKQALATVPV